MIHSAQFEDWVPFKVERVFLFFTNPQNLPRIMPPITDTRIDRVRLMAPPPSPSPIQAESSLAGVGSELETSFRLLPYFPLRAKWIARITEFEWNHHFADIQVRGPFRSWHHRHEMFPEVREGVEGTMVRDRIEYEVAWGWFGELAQPILSKQIEGTFQYRQRILPDLLSAAK